ncbi:hypothetical protein [Dehalococcoides mccartyi]|uniref:hypothetical protein n=1 Tax=Dehalococcoides mccartyi TaxID=61435 RepID=UPI001CE583E5|nr:hypothetical protein [Dehalococcoides mccartyi]QYY58431.1 hypothetical protein CWV2_000335 [Dehalococcoides mccartyi]
MNNTIMNLITSVAVMAVFNDVARMLKAFIGPKLEKRLGRPPTERDWQVYWQEKANRDRYTAWNDSLIKWQQQRVDQQIIRDFVWNED